jgi:hypothetical protein
MLVLLRNLFGTDVTPVRQAPAVKTAKPVTPAEDPEPTRDPHAEKLWREWLEDDDWRTGKP